MTILRLKKDVARKGVPLPVGCSVETNSKSPPWIVVHGGVEFLLTEAEAVVAGYAVEESKQNDSPLCRQVGGDHYRGATIQPVQFIHANGLNFLEGCVVKRLCRHRRKNGKEDLQKAIHELQLLIELEYPEQ